METLDVEEERSEDDDEAPTLIDIGEDLTANVSQMASALDKNPEVTLMSQQPTACPVTILSGFLGSGKTTLIQYILKSPDHGKRIAVIENEYGEGLQVESLIARDGVNDTSLTDLIELPNGCICCTVKDSLVATLENLLEKRNDLDYVLIECSGMANPGPIASLFWLDEGLESRLQLDGIVTLVDGRNILEQIATTEEAVQQIAYADRILLNKTDLIDSVAQESLLHRLSEINPTAQVRATQYAEVSNLDWLLGANCFSPDRIAAVNEEYAATAHAHVHKNKSHCHTSTTVEGVSTGNSHIDTAEGCSHCHTLGHERCTDHRHTAAITTISLKEPGHVDLSRVDIWLASVLWPNQDEANHVLNTLISTDIDQLHQNHIKEENTNSFRIFRIKGIVSAGQKDARRHIVQAVHDLWEIHPASDNLRWERDEQRVSKLVLIGRHLPEKELREGFRSCCCE